jgi:hypothetical protein
MDCKTEELGFEFQQGQIPFPFSAPFKLVLGPTVCTGVPSQGSSGRDLKLNTHLHTGPKLRMRGIIPPLLHTSSRCGAQFNTGTNLPLLGMYSNG